MILSVYKNVKLITNHLLSLLNCQTGSMKPPLISNLKHNCDQLISKKP